MKRSGWGTGAVSGFVICLCVVATSGAFCGTWEVVRAAFVMTAGALAVVCGSVAVVERFWPDRERGEPQHGDLAWAPPPPPQRKTTVYRERAGARPWGFCLAVGDPYAIAALEAYAAAAEAAGDRGRADEARAMAAQWAACAPRGS